MTGSVRGKASSQCSHVFRDSKTCVYCSEHISDLTVEAYAPEGDERIAPHAREHVLRVVRRFGEPTTDALRARVAKVREQQGKAEGNG